MNNYDKYIKPKLHEIARLYEKIPLKYHRIIAEITELELRVEAECEG